jgi:hypothetical protein
MAAPHCSQKRCPGLSVAPQYSQKFWVVLNEVLLWD